jgi:hypothetical protein
VKYYEEIYMGRKFQGKFEAAGRVGLRANDTRELISVYPYKVEGTDDEIEQRVIDWYCQKKGCGEGNSIENYLVDTLNPGELKDAQEKFLD